MKVTFSIFALLFSTFLPIAAKADSLCHTPASTFNASLAIELGVCDASGNLMIKTVNGSTAATSGFTYLSPNSTPANGALVGGYAGGDGGAAGNDLSTASYNLIFNGSSWDRERSINAVGQPGIAWVGQEPVKYTYSSANESPPLAGSTFFLCGSATKLVRVRHLGLSGDATTAGSMQLYVYVTSSAPTGGTSAALGIVAHATGNPASTATATYYTVTPTGGATPIGIIFSAPAFFASLTTAPSPIMSIDYGPKNDQAITLSGTGQCVDLIFTGAVPNGAQAFPYFEWTEE